MPSGSIPHGTQRANANKRHDDTRENPPKLDETRHTATSFDEMMAARSKPLYGMMPFRANTDDRLTHFQVRVFSTMCGYANNETHLCWPKQKTLAQMLHTSVSQISQTITRLVECGYVEIQKIGFPARNVYKIIWEIPAKSPENIFPNIGETSGEPEGKCLPATEFSVGETQTLAASKHRVYPGLKSYNIPIEHTNRTPRSEREVTQHSLAQSAETAAETTTATVTAPPERRTRERLDISGLKRDALVIALIACLNREPATRREWDQWRIARNELNAAGVKAADIPRIIRGYQTVYPKSRITPIALSAHLSEIREGKAHDIAQLEVARRAAAAEAAERHDREHADAERRAAQQREVERMLREWDDEIRQHESTCR